MDVTVGMVVLGAAVAGFVQGLSGFAFSLVAMSFWAWVLEPQLAAVLAVVGALTGQCVAAFSVRRGLFLKQLMPFVLGGLAGLPLGLWLLPWLDMAWFKTLLGSLLLLWCPAMLCSARLPQMRHGGRWADALVGLGGGLMGALGGFSGTVPTLWCTLRNYPRDLQRSVIQNFNLAMLLATLLAYAASGLLQRETWPMLAWLLPAMLIPSYVGARVYLGISDQRFRQLVLSLLTLSGLTLLCSGLPQLLQR